MKNILDGIGKDIKKCDDVIIENDYLEMAITIEELVDKYENKICDLKKNSQSSWNYSKNDLIILRDKLRKYKDDEKSKYNKLKLENVVKETINNIKKDEIISQSKKQELINNINEIYDISKKNISEKEMWNLLRKYINISSKEEFEIGTKILLIINCILNF